MKYLSWVAVITLVVAAIACGSTTAGNTVEGMACVKDADCGAGFGCGYAQADGCGAKGTCKRAPTVNCAGIFEGCACDGTSINVACTPYGNGYVAKPFKHSGPCTQPKKDCVQDTDCGAPNLRCGYLASEACAAKGTCVEGSSPPCASNPGCACDGTLINLGCGLPSGYMSKPLLHAGVCSADGGTDAPTE